MRVISCIAAETMSFVATIAATAVNIAITEHGIGSAIAQVFVAASGCALSLAFAHAAITSEGR